MRGPWVCKTYSPRTDREEMIKNGSAWSAANDRGGWHHRLLRWAGVASAARHTRRRESATRDHPPKPTQSAPSKASADIGEVVAERIRTGRAPHSSIWLRGGCVSRTCHAEMASVACVNATSTSTVRPAYRSRPGRGQPDRSPRGRSGARRLFVVQCGSWLGLLPRSRPRRGVSSTCRGCLGLVVDQRGSPMS